MLHTRKDINCSELKDLYINREFSLLKIGKILGFSYRTIEIKAKECKILLRKPGVVPPNITDRVLKLLYLQKGMSSRKIAKIYACAYSYIDMRIIKLNIPRRNLANAHITTKRRAFSGNPQEKAYLIGFRIGDLRVRKMYKNSETILVDCGSTKPNQIKLICALFKKYGRVWIGKPHNNKVQIECSLNNTFTFLMKNYKKFPNWIDSSSNLRLFALAGFIDAEGSFFVGRKRKEGCFSVGNYNQTILKQIDIWLKDFGFKTRLILGVRKGYTGKDGYSHNSDYWILSIPTKKNLFVFTTKILPYLKHKGRILDAHKVLKNIKARNLKYGFIGM